MFINVPETPHDLPVAFTSITGNLDTDLVMTSNSVTPGEYETSQERKYRMLLGRKAVAVCLLESKWVPSSTRMAVGGRVELSKVDGSRLVSSSKSLRVVGGDW
ncbi:hypothetical protein Pmani_026284 [Petrolisthes manimaculis]|uniref:Uncharacterized protein n=1 Tax=Petrolisthes manimaculis TaxID=1843537 RepID=A0AAE1TXX7_9EUCA|nr:hypothetical protein Pmani_026284 [Petrolisthes manimaculis]